MEKVVQHSVQMLSNLPPGNTETNQIVLPVSGWIRWMQTEVTDQ